MNSTNITNIAFEQISGDYYWGKYGEFKVIINKATGYINATHLCGMATSANGNKKEFKHWKTNAYVDELMKEVSSLVGYPTNSLLTVPPNLPNELRGTYAHPDLIPSIASWASPAFGARANKIINAHLTKEYMDTIKDRDDNIAKLRDEIRTQSEKIDTQSAKIDELLNYAKEQKDTAEQTQADLEEISVEARDTNVRLENVQADLNTVQTKLGIAVTRRVPPEQRIGNREIFALYKNAAGKYKAIRCQLCNRDRSVGVCVGQGYVNCVYSKIDPSAVSIFNSIKLQLPANIGRVTGGFFISLAPAATEDQLIDFINLVDGQRVNV